MDFKTQAAPAAGLAALTGADALLVVVCGDKLPALDKPLADLLAAAVKDGDFKLERGQLLQAWRAAGVKAPRLVFVHGGDGAPKALRKAVGAGLAPLKGGGAQRLAIAVAGGPALEAAHGEAVAAAVHETLYVYRETKPSAPPAARLAGVTLVCGKGEATAAAELAYQLWLGRTPAAGQFNAEVDNGRIRVPAILLQPISVTRDNLRTTILADKFWEPSEVCVGEYATACLLAGIEVNEGAP